MARLVYLYIFVFANLDRVKWDYVFFCSSWPLPFCSLTWRWFHFEFRNFRRLGDIVRMLGDISKMLRNQLLANSSIVDIFGTSLQQNQTQITGLISTESTTATVISTTSTMSTSSAVSFGHLQMNQIGSFPQVNPYLFRVMYIRASIIESM